MSSKMRHGDGEDCYLIKETGVTFESDPVVGILDFRGFDRIALQLITTDDLEGDWTIEVSNNYTPAGNGSYGQPPEQGTWTDITSSFEPTISAVTAASNQWAQADLGFRAVKVTFTPSGVAGSGDVTAIQYSKQVG